MLLGERSMSEFGSRFALGRASYELHHDELEAFRHHINASTSSLCALAQPVPPAISSHRKAAAEYATWKANHPSVLDRFDDFVASLRGKRLAVFLDYDGTLTPIVKNPDAAFMSDQMRAAVRATAGLFPTSIISGRGREKVQSFVQLKELFYAGSHGMDIVGPKPQGQAAAEAQQAEEQLAFQPAAKFAPIMDAVHHALCQRVKAIPGATVEHNKFCVSVHFRNCAPESYDAVLAAVKETLQEHSNLKASRGRKVLEIQPQVDWGKGRALAHMLVALGLDEAEDVIPIYLGDDRTDEDAFKVLKERSAGLGILISSKAKPTDAKFTLTDPSEVMAFLTQLVRWGSTNDNAWHAKQSCTGWHLKLSNTSISSSAVLPEAPAQTAATEGTSYEQTSQQQPAFSRQGAAAGTEDKSQQNADRRNRLPPSQTPNGSSMLAQPGPSRQAGPVAAASTSDVQAAEPEKLTMSGNNPWGPSDFTREAATSNDMHDARRSSLDHYLSPEASISQAWQPEQESGATTSHVQETLPTGGSKGTVSGQQLDKNGERLTALLLDKLHGHAARPSDQEEVSSPPALTSNDSGSMAGYRSPFESLASYGLPEEADSVQAEHGSSASLRVMPSIE